MVLKTQDQSVGTLETLAQIKKPKVVISRQANIAQGPQQGSNNLFAHPGQVGDDEETSNELVSEWRDVVP
jgi:hypothetical protein